MASDFLENLSKLMNLIEKSRSNIHSRRYLTKSMKVLKKILSRLRHWSTVFWSSKTTLSVRRKIINDHLQHFSVIRDALVTLYRFNFANTNMILEYARVLASLGGLDVAEDLLNDTVGLDRDFSSLALVSDTLFELGMIDRSLNYLDKLRKIGYKFFEAYYNRVLILYLMGKNIEAMDTVKELEERFGEVPQIMGLKIALFISNNQIDEANRLNMKRRGLNDEL
ncbi:MAG: hypothetical protein ACP6IP_00535 [Candidatus Njordarchaeia archaeon]